MTSSNHCSLTGLARLGLLALALTASASLPASGTSPQEEQTQAAADKLPAVDEARSRARLLHETVHATLHVVHLEYYREDEALKLPAAAMKLVFRELAARHQVELRWLAVNAEAMNVEHQPKDAFEKQAVQALSAGKDEYETVSDGVYRSARPITLSSECLKCHAPNRRSNQARAAGLTISMPVQAAK